MPKPPKLKRFFAQLFGFRYCCPVCGHLNTLARGQQARRATSFNRVASLAHCRWCKHAYYVGIIFWAVKRGGGKGGHADQIPNAKELELIQEAEVERLHGLWVPGVPKKRNDPINRVLETPEGEAQLAAETPWNPTEEDSYPEE